MKSRRKKGRVKFIIVMISVIILLVSAFIFVNKLFIKNGKLISPVPMSLSSSGRKIFLSNVSDSTLEQLLRKMKISYSTIVSTSDSSYLIKLETGEEVIISSKKDLNLQVDSLQLILSRLKIEGKRFIRLDLRFDKPVIVFE